MATSASAIQMEQVNQPPAERQWVRVLRRFRRHRMAMISVVVLLLIFFASLLAPLIAPYARDTLSTDSAMRFLPPLSPDPNGGARHWLGTDNLGRDYLTRLMYAARVSLMVAVSVTVISTAVGMLLGLLAGYFGGWVDTIISRTLEFVSTFPVLTILLIVTSILLQDDTLIPLPGFVVHFFAILTAVPDQEAKKITLIMLALILLGWTGEARLMRGQVLAGRESLFIESSRALGASPWRIIARHVFPNAVPPLIVGFTLALGDALVTESALSFLGFGIQDPTPTWGNMLAFAQSNMFNYPWMPLVPGLPILICSLAINYIGDGLRDALDPRSRL